MDKKGLVRLKTVSEDELKEMNTWASATDKEGDEQQSGNNPLAGEKNKKAPTSRKRMKELGEPQNKRKRWKETQEENPPSVHLLSIIYRSPGSQKAVTNSQNMDNKHDTLCTRLVCLCKFIQMQLLIFSCHLTAQ